MGLQTSWLGPWVSLILATFPATSTPVVLGVSAGSGLYLQLFGAPVLNGEAGRGTMLLGLQNRQARVCLSLIL